MTTFKQYMAKTCGERGEQKSNLTPSQAKGLKSAKKGVKEGDMVIIPTDKSGRLAAMSRTAYLEAGMSHTRKDTEVSWEKIKESQRELNGHVSMLIKCFRIGSYWKHGFRARETMMGDGQSVCPLSHLYKDHKGWSASLGTTSSTRPVAGSHLGINLHISEIVSDLLDPVVAHYRGGRDIISTEDMVARVEILNDKEKDWTTSSYWGGMILGEYRACGECQGRKILKSMPIRPALS